MGKRITGFYKNTLYILVPLIILVGIISYDRIIIKNDYLVRYEGVCDPEISSCFWGCEDEECSIIYYYSKVEKYAPDLYKQCGDDITDCEEANICFSYDTHCSITYCDTATEKEGACSSPTNTKNYQNTEEDDTPPENEDLQESL